MSLPTSSDLGLVSPDAETIHRLSEKTQLKRSNGWTTDMNKCPGGGKPPLQGDSHIGVYGVCTVCFRRLQMQRKRSIPTHRRMDGR
jgi:hypothetical protein